MSNREKTDDEIRAAILDHFARVFGNFSGDYLDETVEGTGEDYDRATELMTGAEIRIDWPEAK